MSKVYVKELTKCLGSLFPYLSEDCIKRTLQQQVCNLFLSQVVFAPPNMCTHLESKKKVIDTILVDDASLLSEMQLRSLLSLQPNQIVMVGDAFSLNVQSFLFGQLTTECPALELSIQRQMSSPIAHIHYQLFVDSRSSVAEESNAELETTERLYKSLSGGKDLPFCFMHIESAPQARKMIADCVQSLGVIKSLIVTLDPAEEFLLNRVLPWNKCSRVVVASPEALCGWEADVVFVSLGDKPTLDARSLYYALSRAKHKLVCVGNVQKLHQLYPGSHLAKLFNLVNQKGLVVKGASNTSASSDSCVARSVPLAPSLHRPFKN